MTEDENGIEIPCPDCSPQEPVWHEILKPGQNPVAGCMECGHVHRYTVEKARLKDVKVIVSKMENTIVLHSLFNENDRFDVDDEAVIDDEATGEAYPVMITSIECGGRRPGFAKVREIDTIWARAIDEVTVRIAVRRYEVTASVLQKVPGDFLYVVGGDVKIDGKTYPITAIKVRGGGFRKKEGDAVPAKKIKRVFTKDPASGYGKGRYGNARPRASGRRVSGNDGQDFENGGRGLGKSGRPDPVSDRDRRYREWHDRQNSRAGPRFSDRPSDGGEAEEGGSGGGDARRPFGVRPSEYRKRFGKKPAFRRNGRPVSNRGRR